MSTIYTIGHSTRPWSCFLSLLHEHKIQLVVDVRRSPHSRKFPQFDQQELKTRLAEEGREYLWMEALGGWRHRSSGVESPNMGLRSPGLRNYADHMVSGEFAAAVQRLLAEGAQKTTAILCAERLYWRCHRRLLCDYLVSRGATVLHIEDRGKVWPHRLTPGAMLTQEGVMYPAGKEQA